MQIDSIETYNEQEMSALSYDKMNMSNIINEASSFNCRNILMAFEVTHRRNQLFFTMENIRSNHSLQLCLNLTEIWQT